MNIRLAVVHITVFLLGTLYGCSPDESVVSTYDGSWRYLIATRTGLATLRMPMGTIENPSVWNGSPSYPITRLYEFRDHIYALTSTGSVIALDRESLAVRDTLAIDSPNIISGVAFANATTAYVTVPARQSVGVVDLTTAERVAWIPLDGDCSDLAVLGNQIIVVHSNRPYASVLDTRTNSVVQEILLPNSDAFRVISVPATNSFAILCGGVSVASSPNDPLPSVVIVNALTRQAIASSVLSLRTSSNPRQRPFDVAANDIGFLYAVIEPSVMFINSRSPNPNAAPLILERYGTVRFHAARAEFVLTGGDGRTIDVYDQFVEDRRHRIALSDSITAAIGIAP